LKVINWFIIYARLAGKYSRSIVRIFYFKHRLTLLERSFLGINRVFRIFQVSFSEDVRRQRGFEIKGLEYEYPEPTKAQKKIKKSGEAP
jgi:hypothetical protein